jgi:hypothetical protein
MGEILFLKTITVLYAGGGGDIKEKAGNFTACHAIPVLHAEQVLRTVHT